MDIEQLLFITPRCRQMGHMLSSKSISARGKNTIYCSLCSSYETPDGQRRQETGQPSSSSAGSIVQAGSWSYTGIDGKLYEVTFVADELGYRPVGGHIHPAHIQAQRQARRLAGKQITNRGGRRIIGQEERTNSSN